MKKQNYEKFKFDSLEKSLDYIQSIINRMADNSFSIKKFTVTLETAIPAFTINKFNINIIIFIVLFVLVVFCLLDSYYLCLERRYRKLYEKAVSEGDSYDMYNLKLPTNIINNISFTESLFSKTIFLFYGLQIIFFIFIILIINANYIYKLINPYISTFINPYFLLFLVRSFIFKIMVF